jgi:hypothetical protein
MRPIFFAILLTIVSTPAFAATTWSSLDSQGFVRKAVCTTGTEAAPALATAGLSAASLASVVVVVESGSAFGAGARLNAYTWNQFSAAWSRQPEADLELDATLEAQTIGPLNPGPVGRLVFAPSGLAAASTITLIGSPSAEGVRPQALDAYGRVYTRVVGAGGGVPEVRGTVVVTSPDGGLPEVGLGDLLTALAPGYVAIVDALGNQIGIAAAPLASEPIVDGAAVGAANPLPQSIWGVERGATQSVAATVSTLGNDHAGVDVAIRSESGALLGTETNRLATSASATGGGLTGAVTVPDSIDVSVPATALENRRGATVQNLGPSAIYCCLQTGCTAATGMRVLPGGSMYRGIGPSVGIFCISSSGDADVRVEEVR